MKGTKEAEICPELLKVCRMRKLDYYIICKSTFSGYYGAALGTFIRTERVVVLGCVTDVCISANVFELIYRGKKITLLRDCIDTFDIPGVHDAEKINDTFFNHVFPTLGVKVKYFKEVA